MAPPGPRQFETTRWSLIDAARGDEPALARAALAELCETYWYPLYAEIRRRGADPESAADLVQAFFVLLLERDDLACLRPEAGRFRAFLLAALRNFLANERRTASREKRGGRRVVGTLDVGEGERRYRREGHTRETPDTAFDRAWALALLDQVFARLRADWAASGKAALFDALKGALLADPVRGRYRALGLQVDLTEGAVRVAVHRLRHQFRQELRDVVAETVTDGAVDDEVRYLMQALGGPDR